MTELSPNALVQEEPQHRKITQTLGHVGEPFEAVIDGPERDCPVIRLCGVSQSVIISVIRGKY